MNKKNMIFGNNLSKEGKKIHSNWDHPQDNERQWLHWSAPMERKDWLQQRNLLSGEDGNDKNSVALSSMDKESKGPTIPPILCNGMFALSKVFEV